MNSKKQILFPKHQQIMEQMGENFKLARKRRKLTTIQVSERAGIDRTTLYNIEKGSGSVSMAAFFNTLRVLGLQDDFKEHITFYDNAYSFMKGGLHTENKPEIFEADENYEIID